MSSLPLMVRAPMNVMMENLELVLLADHPEVLPVLQAVFESEWPEYYCKSGKGDAREDLLAYSNRSQLPIGVVAMLDGTAVGIAVLKAKCVTTHSHLTPWIGGGMVLPKYRRSGIGAKLAVELENIARELGHEVIYSGTSTAISLLEQSGWSYIETVSYCGENVSIYEKAL